MGVEVGWVETQQYPGAGSRPSLLRLRDPLPVIPIPLRSPDADARVDLQEVLHQTYDGPGYAHVIYLGSPDPPLSEDEAAWARPLIPDPT